MRTSFALAAILLTQFALAQSPQLLVTEKPGEKPHPIALAKADVHVLIAGPLSQTTMTLTFANDADRVMEGELVFPLPENATVCAYALDVGGELVESVTIEKQKARVVFETEVRKGVDPGIVEKVTGNNFRTRVYPIPAKGTRTIRVQYVSDLAAGDGSTLVYSLPLKWSSPVKEASLKVEALGASAAPKAEGLPGLEFNKAEDRFIVEKRYTNEQLAADLRVSVPAMPAGNALVERRTRSTISVENLSDKNAADFDKTEHYFVLTDQPDVPMFKRAPKPTPQRVLVVWDASLSRGEVDHTRELAILDKFLTPVKSIDLIVLRNTAENPVRFDSAAKVVSVIRNLQYDGGTSLGALRIVKDGNSLFPHKDSLPVAPYEACLLFTDGISNIGQDSPAAVEIPVYAIAASDGANHGVLRQIATASGGQYLNLLRMTDDQALVAFAQYAPYSLISIEAVGGAVADVYPKLPQPVNGRVTITGRLIAKEAQLKLNYGMDGRVMASVPIRLTQEGANETGLISRYWAQMKLADLSIFSDRYESEITALGKEFNLVTPYTSMIVLETLEQYLAHRIVPPKSRKEMYASFVQRIEERRGVEDKAKAAKIDRVLTMWNNRVAWWKQEFKYAEDFKYVAQAGEKVGAATAVRSPEPNRADAPRPAARPGDVAAETIDAIRAEQERLNGRTAEPAGRGGARTGGGAGGGGGLFGGGSELAVRGTRVSIGDGAEQLKKGEDGKNTGKEATITIKEWSPDAAYLKSMAAAKPEDAYAIYTDQAKSLRSTPAFYLDVADFFARRGDTALAVRILTNIPELGLDDGRLLRIAAHRLGQLKQFDLAIDLFEKVSKLRPEEPQSFRDLALAHADRADASRDPAQSKLDYTRALELLHKVVMADWQRFEEIEVLALMEANRIIAKAGADVSHSFDRRLLQLLDVELRIVMTWDTDNTDIDLHVVEPSGEEANYSHNRTTIGGMVSKDFTQGYGPEEYVLRKLMPGKYTIKANFYGNRDQKLVGPTTVQATVITNYGRADEKRQSLTLRLKDAKDMVEIGTVALEK